MSLQEQFSPYIFPLECTLLVRSTDYGNSAANSMPRVQSLSVTSIFQTSVCAAEFRKFTFDKNATRETVHSETNISTHFDKASRGCCNLFHLFHAHNTVLDETKKYRKS